MIHFTREGGFKRIGLNLYRSRGGFVAAWLWYDVPSHELRGWRFRLRLHMRPWVLWSVERSNVVDDHLARHDLVMVQREVLADTKAAEEQMKRLAAPGALVKP